MNVIRARIGLSYAFIHMCTISCVGLAGSASLDVVPYYVSAHCNVQDAGIEQRNFLTEHKLYTVFSDE